MIRVRRLLDVVSALAMVAPLSIAVAALWGSDHRWPDLLVQFVAPALILCGVGVGVTAILRLWTGTVVGMVALGLSVLAVWPQWFPDRGRPATGDEVLTLYSANLLWDNGDIQAISASIAQADPDVVVLIELGQVAAGRLDEIVPGHPHRTETRPWGRDGRTARALIASRWPLQPIARPADGLHAVAATVRTPSGPVQVIGAHLTRPWPFQYQWGQIGQTQALAELRAGLDGPVIVAGDFNSVSTGRIGRQMRREVGLIPAPGLPGTWPSAVPAILGITIDQVWRSPDLALLERRLGRANGSDHRPVVTRFAYARSTSTARDSRSE